jgi:hypothetical protein
LGAAYASLIDDEAPLVREAVVDFFRAWPDDPLLDEVRSAALGDQMLGPAIAGLALHDPVFLVRHA